MKYDPAIHHRKSMRLQEYDYSKPGEYFVTLCTYKKVCILGEVIEDEVRLTPPGEIANRYWEEIPKHFPNVELDAIKKKMPRFAGQHSQASGCQTIFMELLY